MDNETLERLLRNMRDGDEIRNPSADYAAVRCSEDAYGSRSWIVNEDEVLTNAPVLVEHLQEFYGGWWYPWPDEESTD
jgi:hypothetical protein